MKYFFTILIIALKATFAYAEMEYLHSGYIYIKLGTSEEIKKEVIEHSSIARHVLPKTIAVHLWQEKDGVYLYYPEGTTTYNFVNSISWLNNPPDRENIGYAKGWVRSRKTNEEYFLYPDISNNYGNTLLGANAMTESVEIYLPEARICLTSKNVTYEPLPEKIKELGQPTLVFKIQVDISPSFGNPLFVLTDKKDTKWGYE
jgi:hypothetical protein